MEAGARNLPGPARKLLEQMRGNMEPQTSGVSAVNKNTTYGVIAIVLVAAAAGGWFAFGRSASSPLAAITGGGESVDIKPTDMVHGSANAKVTFVEYASMTCPHCAAFQKDVIPLLNKDYVDTGKVKVVFREYPLDGAARMASAVARCLPGDQYFSFIDLLFKNQMNWIKDFDGNNQLTKEDVLEGLTQMGRFAGMSADKVKACADDPKNLALVDANWMEGQTKYNVNSTPTFIINGVSHAGEIAYPDLQKILDPLVK
jgi:protein-disulfide isomerase